MFFPYDMADFFLSVENNILKVAEHMSVRQSPLYPSSRSA
jgi:hypothetical protein